MKFFKKKKSFIPHTFILLFILVFAACILTYIIPAGEFTRVYDDALEQTVVVPESYITVTQNAISPLRIFHKFYEAVCLSSTAKLVWLILITGGSFEIVMISGCMNILFLNVEKFFYGREIWVIPMFVCIFSIFGFTMGMTTASVVFAPLGIAVAVSMGFDRITGLAMIALGVNAGFTAGVFNPFTVGIAQEIAEIPLFSGIWIRWLTLPILLFATSAYIMFYAKKHRIVSYEQEEKQEVKRETQTESQTQTQEILGLIVFVGSFILLSIGISFFDWDTTDIVVTILCMGILVGLVTRMSISKICEVFVSGCKKMTRGIIVIGIAATIRLVLTEGNIFDTITKDLVDLVYIFPKQLQLLWIFIFNALINFLITSGSSKALLVMPILTPMADSLGLTRTATVFAFQMGDGQTNLASPISTTLNGMMALGEINYKEWMRFYLPLVLINLLLGGILTMAAFYMGY